MLWYPNRGWIDLTALHPSVANPNRIGDSTRRDLVISAGTVDHNAALYPRHRECLPQQHQIFFIGNPEQLVRRPHRINQRPHHVKDGVRPNFLSNLHNALKRGVVVWGKQKDKV